MKETIEKVFIYSISTVCLVVAIASVIVSL